MSKLKIENECISEQSLLSRHLLSLNFPKDTFCFVTWEYFPPFLQVIEPLCTCCECLDVGSKTLPSKGDAPLWIFGRVYYLELHSTGDQCSGLHVSVHGNQWLHDGPLFKQPNAYQGVYSVQSSFAEISQVGTVVIIFFLLRKILHLRRFSALNE